jgi:hypothetical protein
MKVGDRMTFTLLPNGTVLLRVKNRTVMSLAGGFAWKGRKAPAGGRPFPLMIGLDTNVLIRFLTRDDEDQFQRAQRLIRREAGTGDPLLVSLLTLLETEWVLRSRYKLTKMEILGSFSDLLGSVEEALYLWRTRPLSSQTA